MIQWKTIIGHGRMLQKNWVISLCTRSVFGLTVLSLVIFLARYSILPPEVPLWYSKPWGQEQLAHPLWLLVLPAGGLIWYLVDLTIATYITHEYLIFTQVLFLSSFLVSLLSTFSLVRILFLVT